MGGFFGAASKRDVCVDVYFGVDFHSHLGTKRAGMIAHDPELGFQREIHSIESTPFRTKFEPFLDKARGTTVIGCISDADPQPLMVKSHLGLFALTTVGVINNADEIIEQYMADCGQQFMALSSGAVNQTELVAAVINKEDSLLDGLRHAQDIIEGSMTMLLMTDEGEIYAARDKYGRLPVIIGKDADGYCVTFESFVYDKLGYADEYELGPNEIVRITKDGYETVSEPGDEMKICAFLWTYYGYPNSTYEGTNVEVMRYRNGEIMARDEMEDGTLPDVDYVAGIPDSGLPHAIGYSTASGKPFARPFVKYTPTWSRSFMPSNQAVRNHVAKMKQVPVPQLIEGQKHLFVDDSIVRGTQMRETVDFLYGAGAKEVHMRSACPPIMYGCKYLNFSSSKSEMELIARKKIDELEGDAGLEHLDEYSDARTERGQCLLKSICEEMGFDSLRYQSLEGHLQAIGIDPSKVCTYCWTGKE